MQFMIIYLLIHLKINQYTTEDIFVKTHLSSVDAMKELGVSNYGNVKIRRIYMNSKSERIQVVLCEPRKKARIATINNTLASLQQIVGGYIEAVYPFDDPVAIVCDEEGKLRNATLNRSLRDKNGNIYDIIAGPFLVVELCEEDFTSLSKEHREKYTKIFEFPEKFFRIGEEIYALPIKMPEHT